MTKQNACLILGIPMDAAPDERKKKYRRLMTLTHPDSAHDHNYLYEAHEINAAYDYLEKHSAQEKPSSKRYRSHPPSRQKKSSSMFWAAPINESAYIERDIFHYYEDSNGQRCGTVTIDRGKFQWIPDEEFPLFLLSLYQTSHRCIQMADARLGVDRSGNEKLLADLTYLLASQYFTTASALELMNQVSEDGEAAAYFVPAMLELHDPLTQLPSGVLLSPLRVENHHLYIADAKGKELGYLSFKDDRLYYGIIPLFERKAVQVKITTAAAKPTTGRMRKSTDLNLWIRLLAEDPTAVLESINSKIEKLLGIQ